MCGKKITKTNCVKKSVFLSIYPRADKRRRILILQGETSDSDSDRFPELLQCLLPDLHGHCAETGVKIFSVVVVDRDGGLVCFGT